VSQVLLSEISNDLFRFLGEAEGEEIVITRDRKPARLLIGFASEDDWFDYQLENDPRFTAPYRTGAQQLTRGRVRIEDVE
jgi:hypothetical protein